MKNDIPRSRLRSFVYFIISVIIFLLIVCIGIKMEIDFNKICKKHKKRLNLKEFIFYFFSFMSFVLWFYYLFEIIVSARTVKNNNKMIKVFLDIPTNKEEQKISENKELSKVQTKFNKLENIYWNKLFKYQLFCLLLIVITFILQVYLKHLFEKNLILSKINIFILMISLLFLFLSSFYDKYNHIRRFILICKEKKLEKKKNKFLLYFENY